MSKSKFEVTSEGGKGNLIESFDDLCIADIISIDRCEHVTVRGIGNQNQFYVEIDGEIRVHIYDEDEEIQYVSQCPKVVEMHLAISTIQNRYNANPFASEVYRLVGGDGKEDGQAYVMDITPKPDLLDTFMKYGTVNGVDLMPLYNDSKIDPYVLDEDNRTWTFRETVESERPVDAVNAVDKNAAVVDTQNLKLKNELGIDVMVTAKMVMMSCDAWKIPKSIPADHPSFDDIINAINSADWENAILLMDPVNALTQYSDGLLTVEDGRVKFKGLKIDHTGFSKRILELMGDGNAEGVRKISKFLHNVMECPSFKIVSRIFDFVRANNIEITDNGYIRAYKAVTANYLDHYTKSIDNSVGALVQMERWAVNDDDTQTCERGLHACSITYIPHYAKSGARDSRIVSVLIHPRDVVSIPTDYKDAKMRSCEMRIESDVTSAYRSGELVFNPEGKI